MMGSWVKYWTEYAKQRNPHASEEPVVEENDGVKIKSIASYSQLYGHAPVNREDDPTYLSVEIDLSRDNDKLSVTYTKKTKDGYSAKQDSKWKDTCVDFASRHNLEVERTCCNGACVGVFKV